MFSKSLFIFRVLLLSGFYLAYLAGPGGRRGAPAETCPHFSLRGRRAQCSKAEGRKIRFDWVVVESEPSSVSTPWELVGIAHTVYIVNKSTLMCFLQKNSSTSTRRFSPSE